MAVVDDSTPLVNFQPYCTGYKAAQVTGTDYKATSDIFKGAAGSVRSQDGVARKTTSPYYGGFA